MRAQQPRALFLIFRNSLVEIRFLAPLPGPQITMSANGDRQQARSGADAQPRAQGCEYASDDH
jgi:hypothetical protein